MSLALIVVALWLPPAVERFQIASLERQLADEARLVRRLAGPLMAPRHSSPPAPGQALRAVTRQVGVEIGARVTIIDTHGRVLADTLHDPATMDNHASRPEVRAALQQGIGHSLRYSRTLGMDRLYVAVPVFGSGEGSVVNGERVPGASASPRTTDPSPLGVVRLSLSLVEVNSYIGRLRRTLLFSLGFAALMAVGLSLLFARSLTWPLQLLRDVALGWAHGDLSRRAPLRSRDEIGELAQAFDRMASRLQETIAELGRDRSQMRAVFDTMADGLLVADAHGRVQLLNPAAAALLGVSARGAAGRTVLEITLDAPLQTLVDEVLRTGAAAARERALRTPAERVVAVSAVPIRPPGEGDRGVGRGHEGTTGEADKVETAAAFDFAGSPRPPLVASPQAPVPSEGAVLVFHDLTAARRVERMRRDFVANASHELRTPLASMRVMVETLLNGAREDPEAGRRFLQILDRELHRMTDLVNDLLVLSRLDAPVETITLDRVVLAPLVSELETGWQAVAHERGVRLQVAVPEELAVRGEKEGVRQMLANLVDNALKYTPSGEIRVSAHPEAGQIVLEVRDTGIGIPAADLDRIFERFYRADKDRSRDLGGTGLGLSIVKHLAQAYGGSVSVESRLNRGSLFRVRFMADA